MDCLFLLFLLSCCAFLSDGASTTEKPNCFHMQKIPHPSGNGEMIPGYRNVGGCTCRDAVAQAEAQAASGMAGNFSPQCDGDKFHSRQFSTSGHTFCFDSNGNQISEMWQPWMDRNKKC